MSSQDVAIAFLLAQHTPEQAALSNQPVVLQIVRGPMPEKTPSKKGAKGKKAAPIQPAVPGIPGLFLPPKGSLEARGFMLAMRNAGKRTKDGKPFFDASLVRNDQIQAIAAYIGYDPSQNFGSQDVEARAQAERELHNRPNRGPILSEMRAAVRSMAGYVAGMPDMVQRKVEDLLARERQTVDTMLEHMKAAADLSRPEQDRVLSHGLAGVERQRLSHIRRELKSLV